MEKRTEVKPKFLLVLDNGTTSIQEFEDEKELRKEALEASERGHAVIAYKVSARADVSSHPALNLRWK